MTECVVYWKHTRDMCCNYSDGYIGITKNFEERMKQHHRDAFVRNSIYTVHERMRMHGENVITDRIYEGSRKDCEQIEKELRPKWHVGWNMCIGGGSPAKERWYSKLWLDTRLYNTVTKQFVTIKPGYWLEEFVKEYFPNENLRSRKNQMDSLLYGKYPQSRNWEFANAQLAMKIHTRFHEPWNHTFLRKVNEPNHVISLYKSGLRDFSKSIKMKSGVISVKYLITGVNPSRFNWELASEEEWLATTKRLEFK